MSRNLAPQAMCVGHDRFQFLLRVRRSLRIVPVRKHAAGGANFDQIGAILDDLAHLVLHSFHAVRHTFRRIVKFEGQEVLVAVATRDAERRSAYQHSRPRNVTGINGVAQGNVAETLRSHVAYSGEPSLQREARIASAGQRCAWNGNREGLRPNILRIAGEVRMRIRQPRQNCSVGEIDQAIVGRATRLPRRTDANYLPSFDHDGLIVESFSAAHIQ